MGTFNEMYNVHMLAVCTVFTRGQVILHDVSINID